jgi:hypothetical protein
MKTAVEKLAFEISKLGLDLDKTIGLVRLMHEALDDERIQIEQAYKDGNEDGLNRHKGDFSNYYKFTYNK